MLRNSCDSSCQGAMMQTLEQRRMLSVAVVDGVLAVRGTNHADHINVSVDHGQVNVTMNGHVRHFSLSDVLKLKIQAGSGNDVVGVDRSVRLNTMIDGGAGNDSMMGGFGHDDMVGGAGDDVLIGSGAADSMEGDGGNDDLFGGGGNDNLDGGDGNDDLHGGAGDDSLDGEGGHDNLEGGAGDDVASDQNDNLDDEDASDHNDGVVNDDNHDGVDDSAEVVDPTPDATL